MGVSRSPLREAFSTLQAMGLVEIKPRSKIIVRSAAVKFIEDPLSFLIAENIERIFELLEIRRQMESWAAYKAAEKATKEEIEVLREIVQRDQENLNRGIDDPKTDADFHVGISMAAHNTLFSHLTASCHNLLWSSQKMAREKIFRKEENRLLIVNLSTAFENI